jgi:molybdopterin synthase catalytic subunit
VGELRNPQRPGQPRRPAAAARGSLGQAGCAHSEGLLELGEVAVLVGVASAHRAEAFEAARYIIDQVKIRLPIWKLEHYADGERSWVNCHRCAQSAAGAPQGTGSVASANPSSERA